MMVDDSPLRRDDPAVPYPVAWKHLVAIIVGAAILIATICTIATVTGKQAARFSFDATPPAYTLRA